MKDVIEAKIEDTPQNTKISDVIKLEQVVNDYQQMRNVVLVNVGQSTKLASQIMSELEVETDEKLVSAYTNLIDTTNKSLKILTDSYKTISDILLNISKLESTSPETNETTTDVEITSTSDILKRLRNAT